MDPIQSILWQWYCLAFAFGAVLGAGEIVGRYKASPFIALRSPHAITYIAINGILSVAALGAVSYWNLLEGPDNAAIINSPLGRTLLAGFGAAFVFRAKITIPTSETGEEFGPGKTVDALMYAIKRKLDGEHSARNTSAASALTCGISFKDDDAGITALCLQDSTAAASEEDKATFAEDLNALAQVPEAQISDQVKTIIFVRMLANLVGHDALRAAITTYRSAKKSGLPPAG